MFMRTRSKETAEFAINLAQEFYKNCPPDPPGKTLRVTHIARAIDAVCNQAGDFQRMKRLGIYGRAKLGTEFKMRMKELGYPGDFIDELLRRLLMSMSGK